MGMMKDLEMDIKDLLCDGYDCVSVSAQLNCPLEWVEAVYDNLWDDADADPGELDGDWDSAMASAGYGMDEDYGFYGE